MGLDLLRFKDGKVDEELICPICSGVLEAPVQAPLCEHTFCYGCIREWLSRGRQNCPVDRQEFTLGQLKPAPRILKNFLSRLEIQCEYADSGCGAVVKLDLLTHHLKDCEHNPKKPVACPQGCGLTIPKDEMKNHNCVRELRMIVNSHEQKLSELYQQLVDLRNQFAEQRKDLLGSTDAGPTGPGDSAGPQQVLARVQSAGGSGGGSVRAALPAAGVLPLTAMPVGIPAPFAMVAAKHYYPNHLPHPHHHHHHHHLHQHHNHNQQHHQHLQHQQHGHVGTLARPVSSGNSGRGSRWWRQQEMAVATWCTSLPRAKVARWGGMISTPDAELQAQIRRSLADSGCPDQGEASVVVPAAAAGAAAVGSSSTGGLLDDLMANAHERRWPTGLQTLETRQVNRRLYEQYVCRRVPGRQAVCIMACENRHMSDDMIVEPGLVIIFAHGIE